MKPWHAAKIRLNISVCSDRRLWFSESAARCPLGYDLGTTTLQPHNLASPELQTGLYPSGIYLKESVQKKKISLSLAAQSTICVAFLSFLKISSKDAFTVCRLVPFNTWTTFLQQFTSRHLSSEIVQRKRHRENKNLFLQVIIQVGIAYRSPRLIDKLA